MREIGIMGGTFNPVHMRELMVAQFALEQFGLEKVLFMPNGKPPHKTDVLDKKKRFRLVVVSTKDNPRFEPSRIEIDRKGVTWTIDTLKELKRIYGDKVRLNFICGADVIEQMRRYDRRDELLSLCRLLVSPRDTDDPESLKRWRETLPGADIEKIDCPTSSMSSTLIRKWIKEGKSIRYVVHPAAARIIEAKGYYKDAPPKKTPARRRRLRTRRKPDRKSA